MLDAYNSFFITFIFTTGFGVHVCVHIHSSYFLFVIYIKIKVWRKKQTVSIANIDIVSEPWAQNAFLLK